jgi:hypothetical protein
LPAQTHSISSFFLRLLHGLTMDLAFGATEDAGAPPPVTVVSDRSNGICCGVLGCFKNAAQTLKMAICALLHPLRPTMKAPGAPDVATVPTDATADTTVVVRRGRGKPLSNCERIRMLQALLAVSQRRRQVAPWRYCCCCSQVWNV